jgi:hypothetical protein
MRLKTALLLERFCDSESVEGQLSDILSYIFNVMPLADSIDLQPLIQPSSRAPFRRESDQKKSSGEPILNLRGTPPRRSANRKTLRYLTESDLIIFAALPDGNF